MAENEDLVISIDQEDDADTQSVTIKPDGQQQQSPVDDLRAQFNEMQAAKEAADRRAEAARREAENARREADNARAKAATSEADTIESGITAAKAELANAEAEYSKAMETGDYAAAAKAQTRMSYAAAQQLRLDEAKADIEARGTEAPKPAAQEASGAPADPVEAYLVGRTEPTQRWLRSHKEWITDAKKNARLTSAHWSAVAEGHSVDSDGYFKHVEMTLGLRENPNKPQAKRPSMHVAPVSAGSSSFGSGGGTEVRLTKGEAQAATDGTIVWNYNDPSGQNRFKKGDPIGVQEFARRKLKMTQAGQYDRSYVEA